MKKLFKTFNEKETEKLGEALGNFLAPGDIIALEGELGAGKTAFTRGIARTLGVEDDVTSPTFTIINEYPAAMPFVHMDAYRLRNPEEIEDIGFSDYLTGYVVVIEWADMIEFQLPDDVLWVKITVEGDSTRKICFSSQSHRFDQILQELKLN